MIKPFLAYFLAALTMFAGLTLGTGKKAAAKEVVLASFLETGLGIGLADLITAKTAIAAASILIVSGFAVSRTNKPDPIPTSEELYSHLYPLLNHIEHVAPSQVVGVNDPDKDGFGVVNLNTPHSTVQRLKPDQLEDILLNKPQCLRIGACWYKLILDFDLAKLDLPFKPLAIRVKGISNRDRVKGIEFYSVRSRIK